MKVSIVDKVSDVKTPPPTQHITFNDEKVNVTSEIPKLTGSTSVSNDVSEIHEIIKKYNIQLAYTPEDSFRKMSYLTLGIGFFLGFIIWISNIGSPGDDGSQACCFILLIAVGIAPLFDAAHYTKKKEWQQKHAMNHKSSDYSIAINLILGIIFTFIGIITFMLYIINL